MYEFLKYVEAPAGGTRTFMQRLKLYGGDLITRADVVSLSYAIYEISSSDTLTVVEGHDAVAISQVEAVYDSLQTDDPWIEDETGYNFRHTPDIGLNDAFPDWGKRYLLRYRATLVGGDQMVWCWRVTTPSLSSARWG